MPDPKIQKVEFVGTKVAIVLEEHIRLHLDLDVAMADLRSGFVAWREHRAVNQPRIRIDWQGCHATPGQKPLGYAWLHTLRAGLVESGIVGGKDYASLGFDVPAMWVTVVDARTGKPIAFMESDYLSRVRTAASAAIATELLAPGDVTSLAHFGAGKISEPLVRAILKVRPTIKHVCVVRGSQEKGSPAWLSALGEGITGVLTDRERALEMAEIITTATSSSVPVVPDGSKYPHLRHLNLMGANHWKRREIGEELARRCLPANGGYLVVDDAKQAETEAGDFRFLSENDDLDWSATPTLALLLANENARKKAAQARPTAFKCVGIGLMDLAVAGGVLRRMGLLPPTSFAV